MGAMVHGLPLTRLHAVDIFADPPLIRYRKWRQWNHIEAKQLFTKCLC